MALYARRCFTSDRNRVPWFCNLCVIFCWPRYAGNRRVNDVWTASSNDQQCGNHRVSFFNWLSGFTLETIKKIQSPSEDSDVEVGLVGHRFQLKEGISPDEPGEHVYSGINWKVVSDQAIAKAAHVKVVKADVGQLTVKQEKKS